MKAIIEKVIFFVVLFVVVSLVYYIAYILRVDIVWVWVLGVFIGYAARQAYLFYFE